MINAAVDDFAVRVQPELPADVSRSFDAPLRDVLQTLKSRDPVAITRALATLQQVITVSLTEADQDAELEAAAFAVAIAESMLKFPRIE